MRLFLLLLVLGTVTGATAKADAAEPVLHELWRADRRTGFDGWALHGVRVADGRLTLKGGVREILATEMLEALGVETSKSFSLIETGEELERGDEPSPTRSSVLVRLNHSHIRIGTFQRLLYLDETDNLRKLLDYTIRTYMPQMWRDDEASRAVAFLEEVCRRVARMACRPTRARGRHPVRLDCATQDFLGRGWERGCGGCSTRDRRAAAGKARAAGGERAAK